MDGEGSAQSRPMTPESPMTSSLYHATSTINDLTVALANFSRVPSPEPPSALTCCCGKEDCENLTEWLGLKSRLESRLILSAEVGQALLQRYEAYVRRHENRQLQIPSRRNTESSNNSITIEDLNFQLTELAHEKALLEKRLNQSLVNNEVTEVSNKTILQELQDARTTITRLTAHHARSVGWDTRLSAAMKERDDMQQERDSESHRAKLAESKFAALRDKTAKLQVEIRRLHEKLEDKRQHHLESSESLLQDARIRLETITKSLVGVSAMAEREELFKVVESLVEDNEILKRDNAELQQFLADSREDVHALQEEVDEQRANPPSRSGANTPHTPLFSRHFHTGSVPSISLRDLTPPMLDRRTSSADRRRRGVEPRTPETSTSGRPLSPSDSLAPSESRWTSFNNHPHVEYEVEDNHNHVNEVTESERARGHKTLLLLTRSRGVQTDGLDEANTGLSPSTVPSHISTPQDPRSESSSYSESLSSHISQLLERASSLFHRMAQADALTLTNRLKRQHLKGADIGHLSRSTVSNIIAEATSLRIQFRALLEDEKLIITCTRKDLRLLFKFFKDIFTEMGQLRVTLNDVILDPSSATKISELALNPSKAEMELKDKEKDISGTPGWMAPIQKLFAPVTRTEGGNASSERLAPNRSNSSNPVRAPRLVPKLRPALAASATTVNVEFSGTGVGRSLTSTSAQADTGRYDSALPAQGGSSNAMSIFAGAPSPAATDPWVVIPKGPRRVASAFLRPQDTQTSATIGRLNGRINNPNRLSRNVDAVIDVAGPIEEDEEADFVPPLLQRTLRRRGLSDSSIHSTFTSHEEEERSPPSKAIPNPGSSQPFAWPERGSVFQALTRTVQSIRSGMVSPSPPAPPPIDSILAENSGLPEQSATPPRPTSRSPSRPIPRSSSQTLTPRKSSSRLPIGSSGAGLNILPSLSLSSWAAAANMVDDMDPAADPFIAGSSVGNQSYMQRTRRKANESRGGDFY